jgi:hypothetical protein
LITQNKKMLRFRVLSDLHLEFRATPQALWQQLDGLLPYFRDPRSILNAQAGREVMCLCGDLGVPVKADRSLNEDYVALLKMFVQRWPRTVFIAGNHENYWASPDLPVGAAKREHTLQICHQAAAESGAQFLHKSSVVLDDTELLGCTLWSDIADNAFWSMNDSYYVFGSPMTYKDAFREELSWLQASLRASKARRVVVLTHHLPSLDLIHPRFRSSKITSGFATDLNSIIAEHAQKARIWFCGHSHESCEVQRDGVQLALSPLGYPHEKKATALLETEFGWPDETTNTG